MTLQALANTPELRALADYLVGAGVKLSDLNVVPKELPKFAATRFYTSDSNPTQQIRLLPHQVAILEYAFDPENNFTTVVYSTVKKSGKTTIASLVGRWAAETWGRFGEIYCLANDYEQARGRIYQKLSESIELNPRFNRRQRILPDEWRILDRELTHLPSGTKVKALSGDYKGEAGSNPTLTLWSELWGYVSESSRRLWDEMTPVPTRARSMRFIETYAGFEDESDLLLELYDLGHNPDLGGQRIDLPGWPFNDPSPCFVNKQAGLFMYWDEGPVARRMPWQTPDYYAEQAKTLRPNAFDRLHNNYWVSSSEALMPLEWWDANLEPQLKIPSKTWPLVIGVDAAVSNDCTGAVLIGRHPTRPRTAALYDERLWTPPVNGTMNFNAPGGLRELLVTWCQSHNIVQIAYDAYQLHQLMTDLRLEGVAWCKPFSQGSDRMKADKQLYDLVRDRQLPHADLPHLREHIKNAGAKTAAHEDTKFRIVKKSLRSKIDLVIAADMGLAECLRLNLDEVA